MLSRTTRFSPMFSSRRYVLLYFKLKSLIYFEVHMKGLGLCLDSLLLLLLFNVSVQLFHYHLLKSLWFLHGVTFIPLSRLSWLCLCVYVPGLSILAFIFWVYLSSLSPHCPDYCRFTVIFEVEYYQSLNNIWLCILSNIWLCSSFPILYVRPLPLHINFWFNLLISQNY